jgi:hypothetical protein
MNLPTGTMGALCLTFFILSLLAMITNLVSAFLEKETVRKISKPFCLLFLGIAVAFAIPNHPMVYLGPSWAF